MMIAKAMDTLHNTQALGRQGKASQALVRRTRGEEEEVEEGPV